MLMTSSSENLGHKTLKGTIWASIDRFSTIGVQFIVNLVLTRLLLPSDFGAIGMLTIFISVSLTIIDGGFVSALIQKKDADQTDFSTIFFWNIGIASTLYAILFFSAPLIADYYHMPVLRNVVRVIALWPIIFSINVVQTARLRKKLEIKPIALTNVSSIIISGIVGICLAYIGWGVWSLVAHQLCYGAMTTILYYIFTRWLPSPVFSFRAIKTLFSFGGYLFIATIFQELCKNFQGLIIGRRYSATDMGYYTQAYRLDQVTSNAIPLIIAQVMFPVYSAIQDDKQRLAAMVSNHIRLITFILFPLLGCLILSAVPIVRFLYGEKWVPCAAYYQILCVGGFFGCLQNVNYFAVAAIGKSKKLFYWGLYKWGFMIVAMLIAMNFGIYALIWSISIGGLNIYIVNICLVDRHVGLRALSQLRLLLTPFLLVSISIGIGYLLTLYVGLNEVVAALIALAHYILLNFLFRTRGLEEFMIVAKKLMKKNND